MKTNSIFFLMICLLGTAFQCQEDSPSTLKEKQQLNCRDGNPAWLAEEIRAIEENGWEGEIIRYRYHGEYVFLVDACYQCPDYMSSVYNCEKELVCSFGGIAGINTCPDFGDKATNEKIIWKNH